MIGEGMGAKCWSDANSQMLYIPTDLYAQIKRITYLSEFLKHFSNEKGNFPRLIYSCGKYCQYIVLGIQPLFHNYTLVLDILVSNILVYNLYLSDSTKLTISTDCYIRSNNFQVNNHNHSAAHLQGEHLKTKFGLLYWL